MISQSRDVQGRRKIGATTALLLSAAIFMGAAQAQLPPDKPAGPESGKAGGGVPLKSLPPTLRLGVRVNLVERQYKIIPTVVLVRDASAYSAAIRGWTTTAQGATRYPVLIDDGRWATRQRIAQFVRAFGPASVVRWDGTTDKTTPVAVSRRGVPAEDVPAIVWGAASAADLKKQWAAYKFAPPGVVVCSKGDPAETAGIALAAWHGQPIVWVQPPACPDPAGYMTLAQADEFNRQVMQAVDGLGYPWNQIGDEIDGVTLCMTSSGKVYRGDGDKQKFWAFTDLVGRTDEAGGRKRWAWCGQIMGDGPRAAYDAMCALFLQPQRAWLFDGYESSEPWNQFDMTRTADELKKVRIDSIIDDGPSGRGLADLRKRAAGVRTDGAGGEAGMGVDAGLVAFNTSGNQEFFDLKPGQARSVDVPLLRRPAMVYFVHSFSAAAPRMRWTVGGMWMERGAYAYFGSVDEPFLGAFIPTPLAMARLGGGAPWGAAVRMDDSPTWKLAVYGDPLITIGPQGPRQEGVSVPLAGVADVGALLPEFLKERNFEEAMWTLVLTGRDRDASRLLAAVGKDDAKKMTPRLALAGIEAAHFNGDYQTVLLAAEAIAPLMRDQQAVEREGLAEVRDLIWQAINPSAGKPNAREIELLQSFMRPETMDRDRGESGAK